MMQYHSTKVFVSYSHADESLVAPVVKLLRVNNSIIFQDIDCIEPGKMWRSQIGKALAESKLVLLFWCKHASRSDEVSNEWKAAINQKKDLLPLLLDSTPLPSELSDFQWIDLRETAGASHVLIASRIKSPRWLFFAGLAGVFITSLALFSSAFLFLAKMKPSGYTELRNLKLAEKVLDFILHYDITFLAGFLFALTICFAWLLRRRIIRERSVKRLVLHHDEIKCQIASQLEAEILRRISIKDNLS